MTAPDFMSGVEPDVRVAAVVATVAKFDGKPFKLGRYDCARLVAFALKAQGVTAPLLKLGQYSSEAGARRALKAIGCKTMSDVMAASGLAPIPVAATMAGDIVEVESGHAIGSLAVVHQPRATRIVGFINGACAVVRPTECLQAWRAG